MNFNQKLSPLLLNVSLVKNHWLFRVYFFINIITPIITFFFIGFLFKWSFIQNLINWFFTLFYNNILNRFILSYHLQVTDIITRIFTFFSESYLLQWISGYKLQHEITNDLEKIFPLLYLFLRFSATTFSLYVSLKLTLLFPFTSKIFYIRTFVELISTRYLICSTLKILDRVKLGFLYHTRMDKIDLKTRYFEKEWLRRTLEFSEKYTPIKTDISAQVMHRYLKNSYLGYELLAFPLLVSPLIYPINQLNGLQNDPIEIIQNSQPITCKRELKWLQKRIAQLNQYINDIIEDSRYRMNYGNIVPPAFALKRVMSQLDELLRYELDQHPFFKLVKKSFKSKTLRNEFKNRQKINNYLDRFKQKLHVKVYTPYQKLYDFIQQELLPYSNSSKVVGLCSLRNGNTLYKYSLELYTTDSEWTSDRIFEVGMKEIDRIKEKLFKLFDKLGWERNIPMAASRLREDYNFFEDTPQGKEEVLAEYQNIVDNVQNNISHLFSTFPKVSCKVIAVPSFKEKSAPPAYYTPAPFGDRTKSGLFSVNLSSTKNHPKHGMKALAYHESVPGHHFQISIAQEEPLLPSFRQNIPFMAYTEGYALYVERLAYEEGWYTTPLEKIGFFQNEMWRACRLVIDVGIHNKGWSRKQAISFLQSLTGLPESVVTNEVERYIVFPGQAVSYKVGQITIMKLREEARLRLGRKFDIRSFHDCILKCGSVPLDILKKIVEDWIVKEEKLI